MSIMQRYYDGGGARRSRDEWRGLGAIIGIGPVVLALMWLQPGTNEPPTRRVEIADSTRRVEPVEHVYEGVTGQTQPLAIACTRTQAFSEMISIGRFDKETLASIGCVRLSAGLFVTVLNASWPFDLYHPLVLVYEPGKEAKGVRAIMSKQDIAPRYSIPMRPLINPE